MSKSPSLRRIQADIRELALDPSDRYHAAPLENDMFEWHFTIRGAEGTDFEGGIYHGRILLPPEYPFKPPHIIFLTPSGRFETNTKVCLSFSAFHPELWQPAWGIRLILEALISFLPTPADGAIGALDWSTEERQRLAKLSQSYCCSICGKCADLIPKVQDNPTKKGATQSRFAKEIEELRRLQELAERKVKSHETAGTTTTENMKQEEENGNSISDEPSPSISTLTSPSSPTQATATATSTSRIPSPSTITEKDNEKEGKQVMDANMPTNDSEQTTQIVEETHSTTFTNDANAQVVEENFVLDREHPLDDPSWMYDPLLNLMMVLLAVICYLLIQKYNELMEELEELQEFAD